MDQTVRSHLDQFWENKEEVMGVETLKQFTFSLVSDLFLSIKDGPEFNSMAHDIELYLEGIMQLPLDFPGTSYHKARLARESLLQTLGTIISRRCKVQDQNFSKSVKQKFFMLTKVREKSRKKYESYNILAIPTGTYCLNMAISEINEFSPFNEFPYRFMVALMQNCHAVFWLPICVLIWLVVFAGYQRRPRLWAP
jgi:hypothetical protein